MHIRKYLNKEFESIEDPIKFNLKILDYMGVFSKNLFVFWIHHVVTVTIMLGLLIKTVLNFRNYSETVVSAIFFIPIVTAWMKNILFKNNANKTLNLVKILQNPLQKPKTNQQRKMIKDKNTQVVLVLVVFYVIWGGYTIIWWCSALISRELLVDMWLPVDGAKSPFYEIVFLGQTLYLALITIIVNSADLVVYGFINVMSLECKMLCDSLGNIYEISKENLVKRHKIVNEKNIYENMDNVLHSCINQHQFILKLMKKFDEIFQSYIFSFFSTAVLVLCITFLQISEVQTVSEIVFFATYQLSYFIEIFFFCYFSQNLITNSEKIFYAAYETPWFFASKKFRNDILIFMWRVQKPLVVVTGKLFLLSFETFLEIVTVSYRYSTVILSAKN